MSNQYVVRRDGNIQSTTYFPIPTDDFIIVTPIINSPRYKMRAQNYFKFREVCERGGVRLVTIEVAFGTRPFEVTEADDENDIQLRTVDELWHKENAINVAFKHVRKQWPNVKYLGWFDSDQFPLAITPEHWFQEIVHQLQHYEIVQCWEYLINFGPDGQPTSRPQMSFMKTYAAAGFQIPKGKNVPHTLAGDSGMVSLGRPGLAWAANVSALDKIGGLLDRCIVGSGDWHMAHALVGGITSQGGYSWETDKLNEYCKYLLNFQRQCEHWIKRDVGFAPVTVGHWHHGSKDNRRYGSRGEILVTNQYNPHTDVKYDTQGLLQLETREDERHYRLRDLIRNYMGSRNEDDVALR